MAFIPREIIIIDDEEPEEEIRSPLLYDPDIISSPILFDPKNKTGRGEDVLNFGPAGTVAKRRKSTPLPTTDLSGALNVRVNEPLAPLAITLQVPKESRIDWDAILDEGQFEPSQVLVERIPSQRSLPAPQLPGPKLIPAPQRQPSSSGSVNAAKLYSFFFPESTSFSQDIPEEEYSPFTQVDPIFEPGEITSEPTILLPQRGMQPSPLQNVETILVTPFSKLVEASQPRSQILNLWPQTRKQSPEAPPLEPHNIRLEPHNIRLEQVEKAETAGKAPLTPIRTLSWKGKPQEFSDRVLVSESSDEDDRSADIEEERIPATPPSPPVEARVENVPVSLIGGEEEILIPFDLAETSPFQIGTKTSTANKTPISTSLTKKTSSGKSATSSERPFPPFQGISGEDSPSVIQLKVELLKTFTSQVQKIENLLREFKNLLPGRVVEELLKSFQSAVHYFPPDELGNQVEVLNAGLQNIPLATRRSRKAEVDAKGRADLEQAKTLAIRRAHNLRKLAQFSLVKLTEILAYYEGTRPALNTINTVSINLGQFDAARLLGTRANGAVMEFLPPFDSVVQNFRNLLTREDVRWETYSLYLSAFMAVQMAHAELLYAALLEIILDGKISSNMSEEIGTLNEALQLFDLRSENSGVLRQALKGLYKPPVVDLSQEQVFSLPPFSIGPTGKSGLFPSEAPFDISGEDRRPAPVAPKPRPFVIQPAARPPPQPALSLKSPSSVSAIPKKFPTAFPMAFPMTFPSSSSLARGFTIVDEPAFMDEPRFEPDEPQEATSRGATNDLSKLDLPRQLESVLYHVSGNVRLPAGK